METPLAPSATCGRASVVQESLPTMGTVANFDVVVADGYEGRFHLAMASARAELRRAESLFSLWIADSPMNRVRRGELAADAAPQPIGEVLELCRLARDLSGGWFDAEALPGGPDPTGIVKGWATARASQAFTREGLENSLVNVGGDVMATGAPSPSTPWRVGIAHPLARDRLLSVVELDGAIATSGTYERGNHLYDPKTGTYRTQLASASVTGPDLAMADAFATALAVAGRTGLSYIEALEGYAALICEYDGSVRATAGFPFANGV